MAITVRKAKNGQNKYQVRVRDNEDNWHPTKTFDRKADAERYERELETKKDRGQEPPGAAHRTDDRLLSLAKAITAPSVINA